MKAPPNAHLHQALEMRDLPARSTAKEPIEFLEWLRSSTVLERERLVAAALKHRYSAEPPDETAEQIHHLTAGLASLVLLVEPVD